MLNGQLLINNYDEMAIVNYVHAIFFYFDKYVHFTVLKLSQYAYVCAICWTYVKTFVIYAWSSIRTNLHTYRGKHTRKCADLPKFSFSQICLFDRFENQQVSLLTQYASVCEIWGILVKVFVNYTSLSIRPWIQTDTQTHGQTHR